MGKRLICSVFACALLAFASPAMALPTIKAGDVIRMADGPGNTGGGEFIMTVNNTWSFITFCLQRTQYIDFSNAFVVDAVSTYAYADPASNGGDAQGRDYLSPQTAYLYTMFRNGTLSGYDYTGGNHAASADALQNAIWMFEQEVAMNTSNQFVILANNAVNSGAWSGIGEVRALNLSLNGAGAQDQLALVPVPEPASLLLMGFGCTVAAARLRRRGKSAQSDDRV